MGSCLLHTKNVTEGLYSSNTQHIQRSRANAQHWFQTLRYLTGLTWTQFLIYQFHSSLKTDCKRFLLKQKQYVTLNQPIYKTELLSKLEPNQKVGVQFVQNPFIENCCMCSCTYATQNNKLIKVNLNTIYVLNRHQQRLHIILYLSDIIAHIGCGLNY